MSEYSTGTVESRDGTTIGFRRMGSGPALIVLHGGMQGAQNMMGLATAMSEVFEVFVVDRQGRGLSGTHAAFAGVTSEVEDIQAVAEASGATRIFGLSAGALVTLRTALNTPALTKVAVYEPPLGVGGSAPVGWLPRYERELAAGKIKAAMVTGLKGIGTDPFFARMPRFLLSAIFGIMPMPKPPAGDIAIPDLVPTLHYDMKSVLDMAETGGDYSALAAEVLLLGGSKSPAFLGLALDELERTLPHSRRITFDGLGHNGPDDDGKPARVAVELKKFFR